jgi:hypothetical protein
LPGGSCIAERGVFDAAYCDRLLTVLTLPHS